MNSRLALLGLAVVLAVAGCTDPEPAASAPTGGAGSSTNLRPGQPGTDELARAIEAARLPDCPATDARPAAAGGLPALTLDCLGAGPAVALPGLGASGHPIVINVWASWCSPCAAEMPRLTRAAAVAKGRVDFLGIDLLDDRVAALEWARAVAMNFPSVYDHDGLSRDALQVVGPPMTYFVRADGRVAHVKVGEIRSDQELAGLIETHLGVAL